MTSISKTEGFVGPISSESKSFLSTIETAADPSKSDVVINLVESDLEVPTADFESTTVDINDVKQFDNSNVTSAAGTLAQEIAEQKYKEAV